MQNVAQKLLQLRNIVREIMKKKCVNDQLCATENASNNSSAIVKKDIIPNNHQEGKAKFYWSLKSRGCSVSCGRGK